MNSERKSKILDIQIALMRKEVARLDYLRRSDELVVLKKRLEEWEKKNCRPLWDA